jgi:hypothetical protein
MLPKNPTSLTERFDIAIREHRLDHLRGDLVNAAIPTIQLYYPWMPETRPDLLAELRKVDPAFPDDPAIDLSDRWIQVYRREIPLGGSRLGGVPDLPPSIRWPECNGKKLPFVTQIELSTIERFDGDLLPRDGWLYLFAGGDDFPMASSLIYFAGQREQLVRQGEPAKDDVYRGMGGRHLYRCVGLTESHTNLSLLSSPYPPWVKRADRTRYEKLVDKADALLRPSFKSLVGVSLFGHLASMSEDGMGRPVDGMEEMIEVGNLQGDDWLLLMAVHSTSWDVGIRWGDSGHLNVFLRKSDLQRADFSRAHTVVYG